MKKTTNYQLNQWEKTDRIMMDDFYADNEKLDAAIAGRLGPIEEIFSYEYTGDPDWLIRVPVPKNMDWSQYSIVGMEALVPNNNSNGTAAITFKTTDTAPSFVISLSDLYSNLLKGMMLFFPGRKDAGSTFVLGFPGGKAGAVGPMGIDAVVQITGDQGNGIKVPRGTRLRLWGIR